MDKEVQQSINSVKNTIIVVLYKGKKLRIDLTKELEIDTNLINSQLKQLPSNYAFLCSLRDLYIYKRDKLLKEAEDAYNKAWVYYKESGAGVSNDLAEHKAMINPKYLSLKERSLSLTFKVNQLISACKAYETRERIITSLNANLRKQT